MNGKEPYKDINQAIPDHQVIGYSDPLPSAGPVESHQEGRQAEKSGDRNGSIDDCVCSPITDNSPCDDTGTDMAL